MLHNNIILRTSFSFLLKCTFVCFQYSFTWSPQCMKSFPAVFVVGRFFAALTALAMCKGSQSMCACQWCLHGGSYCFCLTGGFRSLCSWILTTGAPGFRSLYLFKLVSLFKVAFFTIFPWDQASFYVCCLFDFFAILLLFLLHLSSGLSQSFIYMVQIYSMFLCFLLSYRSFTPLATKPF